MLTGLVVLLLLASGALGYLVYDQRQDFEAAEERFDAQVEEAEAELETALAATLREVPDVAQLETDVTDLEADVRRHEDALKSVPGIFRSQKGVDDAQDDQLDLLKTCVNDAFERLQRYSVEVAAAVGRIATGGYASPPRIVTPRCY